MASANEPSEDLIENCIEVSCLAQLAACLDGGGVAYRTSDVAVYVDPADGLGNLIMFTAGDR